MKRDELEYMVALNTVMMYNGKAAKELIELCKSAETIFTLTRDDLMDIFGKSYSFFDALLNPKNLSLARKEIEWALSRNISLLCSEDPLSDYPCNLLECPDYPLILYKAGEAPLNKSRMISIVGTRRSTDYGVSMCTKIVRELSLLNAGATIVSGLAYGIDIAAHKAALEYDQKTIAVLAGGLDSIYPVAHTEYAKRILNNGALISEFPRESESHKINFIQRNRIIAGLSEATIIIESGERGGAMITATLANSYSRELFALPGRVSDPLSAGCNLLISKNIASIFHSTTEVMRSLGWETPLSADKLYGDKLFIADSREKEKILLALKHNSQIEVDSLIALTGINISTLSSLLLELELDGRVKAVAGKRYILT